MTQSQVEQRQLEQQQAQQAAHVKEVLNPRRTRVIAEGRASERNDPGHIGAFGE